MNLNELGKYSTVDEDKQNLINEILFHTKQYYSRKTLKKVKISVDFDKVENKYCGDEIKEYRLESPRLHVPITKYCPQCNRKYPETEIVCFDCLVHLKRVSDIVDVRDIEFSPDFIFKGKNDFSRFEDLLAKENLIEISEFNFSYRDYAEILHNVKSQAFKNFDGLIKDNEILFDELDILDKTILTAKSFVNVDFKSYGGQLGYFENNTIYVDDRQTDALQITTLIHELSHFLIKEILAQILCKILDANMNTFVEILSTYILSYSSFTMLIDEYSAHTVEGRFTIFGYQDYSSFRQIEKTLKNEMSDEDVEITKTIGNTFAMGIKDILESFIDRDLREEIKRQFKSDILDRPNYKELAMENCRKLTDDGFMKAIWLILNEGCEVASQNIEKLNDIKKED